MDMKHFGIFSLVLLSFILVVSTIPPTSAQISGLPPGISPDRVFVVIVSEDGFNGTSKTFTLTVNQSDWVRITFIYGDSESHSPHDNPHGVRISTYNIRSPIFSEKRQSAVVEFAAGQMGSFKFYCDVPCAGMENLQKGLLVVRPSGRPLTETKMELEAIVIDERRVQLRASVLDNRSNPLPGLVVYNYVNTTFGWMPIGSATTDGSGLALLNYTLTTSSTLTFQAWFTGGGSYTPSSATIEFTNPMAELWVGMITPTPPLNELAGHNPYLIGQNPMVDLRLVGVQPLTGLFLVSIVLMVVGSVWVVYVYTFSRIYKISKDGKGHGIRGVMARARPMTPHHTPLDTSMEK